jgi:caa(3)-type oxidase subunit IV
MSDSHDHPPAATDPHAAAHAPHEMHVKLYVGIGLTLVALTGFTVFLSYVNFDKLLGGHNWNMVIGMLVATFKVSLVMAIFMHLKGEKPTIWRFLYFTAFFVLGLFLLTALAIHDPIFGTSHNHH